MTTDTTLPTAPSEQAGAAIPHPLELDLSDEEVRRFQQIIRDDSSIELTFGEAKERALEVLRLSLMLVDPDGYAQRMKEAPVLNHWATTSSMPAPVAQHLALPLEGDHARAIEKNLERLGRELRFVKRRPTAWRWALVALWDALAHALAANRPAGFRPEAGLRELPCLFHAVCGEHPELPQVEQSVETLNDLRTQHISLGVTRWPVDLKKQLPGIFHDCLRVIQRLLPEAKCGAVVDALEILRRHSASSRANLGPGLSKVVPAR